MGRLTNLPPMVRSLTTATGYAPNQTSDARRGSSRERGYTTQWDKASKRYRIDHPVCEYGLVGALIPKHLAGSTRVDHLYPQRTYASVFWERKWWVASCDACDAAKQALEHRGKADLDCLATTMGRPIL
jgi:5-methylcytosine-specific restriction protein A